MKSPGELFHDLMRTAPFQPATNLWRAVELDAVQRHGLPGGRGLDLGCGDGKLTKIIDASPPADGRPREWIGVDLDPLETAQAIETGLYRAVHTGSAAAIPEADASVDFVFSNSVLEHIGPIDEVLAEAARLLKPGGQFVLTVPGPGFHKALRGPRGTAARAAYLAGIDARCAHLRYWSREDWAAHLGRSGLRIETCVEYLTPTQTRRWERLSALTGGLLYRLYGGRQRPIEIQRRLRLRGSRPSLAGAIGVLLAPLLATGCRLDSAAAEDAGEGACLLISAIKA